MDNQELNLTGYSRKLVMMLSDQPLTYCSIDSIESVLEVPVSLTNLIHVDAVVFSAVICNLHDG
jgi:hypothetical protein